MTRVSDRPFLFELSWLGKWERKTRERERRWIKYNRILKGIEPVKSINNGQHFLLTVIMMNQDDIGFLLTVYKAAKVWFNEY